MGGPAHQAACRPRLPGPVPFQGPMSVAIGVPWPACNGSPAPMDVTDGISGARSPRSAGWEAGNPRLRLRGTVELRHGSRGRHP